jgi:hypothetical protein
LKQEQWFRFQHSTSPFPPTVRSDENRFVLDAVVEKKFVDVAFVVVEFPIVPTPRLKLVENRSELDAVVEKKLVVVAEVPVALSKIRSARLAAVPTILAKVPLVE